MDEKKVGIEKIVIGKNGLAALAVLDKEEPRLHFRGALIQGGKIIATDTKILIRIPLNEALAKEEIPANVGTGSDTDKVWVSAVTLENAFKAITKKNPIPAIQDNVYIRKEGDTVTANVLTKEMSISSFSDFGVTNRAEDFPNHDGVMKDKPADAVPYSVNGVTILQLANIIKKLGDNISVELFFSEPEKVVFFNVISRNDEMDGAFMLLKNRECYNKKPVEQTKPEVTEKPAEEQQEKTQTTEEEGGVTV